MTSGRGTKTTPDFGLPRRHKQDFEKVAHEVPELLGLLTDMNEKLTSVSQHVSHLKHQIIKEEFPTEKGISLMEVKHQLLLSYLINLVQLLLKKTQGQSISGCPSVERIVEIRTILERIRPLDQKLHYQVDKLLKMANTGVSVVSDDPLRYKPNIDNLVPKLVESSEESGEEDEDDDKKKQKSKLYVPLKLRAMHYDEDEEGGRKQEKAEKLRKKMMHSSLVRELREELWDMPEEIKAPTIAGMRRRREVQEEKEMEQYEEEHFVRLQRKKKKETGRGVNDAIKELTDFGDIHTLTEDNFDKSSKRKRKISKLRGKFKKRSKKGHKGRH